MNHPLVSIITPAFNAEKYINDNILSVVSQTYCHWELIIVDDCSVDGTVQSVKKWQERDERIRLFCNRKNLGPGPSRNLAVEKSQGRFVAFLDSDDIWLPEKLQTQVNIMLDREAVMSFASYETIDEKGKLIGKVIKAPIELGYESLLRNTVIGCLTVMVDKLKYPCIKMPDIPCRQPLVLWLKILRETGPAVGIPQVLARYRVRSDSISSNKYVAAKQVWQVYRQYEKQGLLKSTMLFTCYALNSYKRNIGLKRQKLDRGLLKTLDQ